MGEYPYAYSSAPGSWQYTPARHWSTMPSLAPDTLVM
jgi:hypothetical protein